VAWEVTGPAHIVGKGWCAPVVGPRERQPRSGREDPA
jgi:hypothetical protein